MSKELTPLMRQYWEIKNLHKDKILFFRMGDFFELFYEDAVTAAPLLGLTLTQRNKKSEDYTPMCGMPHHSVANPINKLLTLGFKVAICDQVEDPKLAKGIVKRAVTRILTPGMVYDSDNLDANEAHYICSVDDHSMSFVDTTTGESFYFSNMTSVEAQNLFSILPVAEIVIASDFEFKFQLMNKVVLTQHDQFEIDAKLNSIPTSALRLLSYIASLSESKIQNVIQPFVEKKLSTRMNLNSNAIRHLEIFQTYKSEEKGSLYSAINRTQTSAGARLLRQWLRFPLIDAQDILQRQQNIDFFREHLFELKKCREILPKMGDIERRLAKIAMPQCHGRDLTALASAVTAGLEVVKSIEKNKLVSQLPVDQLQQLCRVIENTIVEDAPLSTKQGHLIKLGVSSELDEIIQIANNSSQLISDLEKKEKELTGISSLKIRYNGVFGYYIEVTHTHADKVPSRYQRKQTLANAERFCTDELLDIERKVLSAQTRRNELESILFEKLRLQVIDHAAPLIQLAKTAALVDVFASLAWLSLEENYVCPQLSQESYLHLESSRHPVVEQHQRAANKLSKFVANTISLNPKECFLITGPNMAGKSTLMRQVALTAILSQIGSYVPASSAVVPIYSGIYTRIGASDQLTEGLSTFMVEMSETAEMLKLADGNSLMILDEIGRGTATFDGMCLAQAILEFICNKIKTHVLFATHYHELTALNQKYSHIKNVHMQIQEDKGQIHFLYLLKAGAAGKSYGIQVAELAGLPKEIIQKATLLLEKFEKTDLTQSDLNSSVLEKKMNSSHLTQDKTDQNIKKNQMTLF